MEAIKSKIGQAGIVLAVMGFLSIVLSIFNYNIRLLAWVDAWGNTIGWIIRVLLIVAGFGLYFFFGDDEDDE